jgi:WbqC-like protein family
MPQRTLVAHQPTYVPYLGLLHKAARADVFVVQDDLRYVKDAVSNRNRISQGEGWKWLTIPVHKSDGSTYATVTPAEPAWPETHQRFLTHAYGRAPHFSRFSELHERNAANRAAPLSVVNVGTLEWMLGLFRIHAQVIVESSLGLPPFDDPNDRLITLARDHDCDRYLSGVGGHAYIDPDQWTRAGVELLWSDYEPLPYDRGGLPWIPNLSALDAIAWVDDLPALLA